MLYIGRKEKGFSRAATNFVQIIVKLIYNTEE